MQSKHMFLLAVSACLLSWDTMSAVHHSQSGHGQFNLIPFYSVDQGLNTVFSIHNTQNQPKAIKVIIKDGHLSMPLLSFNLYLDSNDAWNTVLIKQGDELKMIYYDESCGLNLPETSDFVVPLPAENANNFRWENGLIEVIEMGNVDTNSGTINSGENGLIPLSEQCEQLAAAWENNGVWQTDPSQEMLPASGGVLVQATLIDVSNGFAFDVPVEVLDGFHPESSTAHFNPEVAVPDISSGTHESLLIHDSQVWHTTWPTGYEAVSALLMKTTLANEYDVTAAIAGVNEWVISFPTLAYHQANPESSTPFWFEGSDEFRFPGTPSDDYKFFDRDGQISGGIWGCIPILPPDVYCPPLGVLSHAVNIYVVHPWGEELPQSILSEPADEQVRSLNLWGSGISNAEFITGQATLYIKRPDHVAIGVYDHYLPNTRGVDASTDDPVIFHGLPVTGFAVQVYQNMNAQPGLLATYATAKAHQGERLISTEE
ncbi:hypothetical protein [Marinicella meishanensis]|uniref:hypothetical protein n=1 Tax=Marinicella meishanensis TaxID=2873263 RepID=UPI001CBFA744|nr:hypothetical protein [Marinicella sp. NBU2979]